MTERWSRVSTITAAVLAAVDHHGRVRPETAAVLGPILRDWDSSGIDYWVQEDWAPSPYDPYSAAAVAMVWTPDGSGTGVLIGAPGDPVTALMVLAAAEALHDAVVDDRLLGTTTWPPCPMHPGTHPLTPRRQELGRVHAQELDQALYSDVEVVWACSRSDEVVCRVGELGSTSKSSTG